MDTSGGGPTVSDSVRIPDPASVASAVFQRYILPGQPIITRGKVTDPDPADPATEIGVQRPLLAYPAIACTAEPDVRQRLLADVSGAVPARREPGLPDPDVDRVAIDVQVYTFPQDPSADSTGYRSIYKTTRSFSSDPAAELSISLAWTDIAVVDDLPTDTGMGGLQVPTARQVRLQITALCKEDDGPVKYFGGDDVRHGPPVFVDLRKSSADERNLHGGILPSDQFSAYFLQPDKPDRPASAPTALARLAALANLPVQGNTLRAQRGQRVMFGCTSAIPHQIGPDGASLTLSTTATLARTWIVLVRVIVARDWSWDAFAHDAITVQRDGNAVGVIRKTNALGNEAAISQDDAGLKASRSHTEFLFFDSIDPSPASGQLPKELEPIYTLTPTVQGSPTVDPPLLLTIRLPITTPPVQVPRMVSAGVAMSPYKRAGNYASTGPRQKRLWLEFESPLADPRDAYFARVLRNVPDLWIFPTAQATLEQDSPPLPIDPEDIRHILRDQPADYAGLGAMVNVTPFDGISRIY